MQDWLISIGLGCGFGDALYDAFFWQCKSANVLCGDAGLGIYIIKCVVW